MNEYQSFKLIYFPLRALAEIPIMLMNYGNLKFDYLFARDYFGKEWSEAKPELKFGKLPILIIDNDELIWQSGAIVRFLAKLTDTYPQSPILTAKVDAIFEQTKDMSILNPIVNFRTGEKHLKEKEDFFNDTAPIMKDLISL